MIIAVDFDGTCVKHEYPDIGHDVPYAVDVLNKLNKAGHQLILWTMRSDKELGEAVEWFADRNIPLFGIQRNPDQHWTNSPKAYAHIYIDDAALGCPLIFGSGDDRDYVDWQAVEHLLIAKGCLTI